MTNSLKLNQSELAWAAGFFDGEGCTHLATSRYTRKDGTVSISRLPRVAIAQTEPTVLERFRAAVGGIGTISKAYARQANTNARPCYGYRVTSFEEVQAVVAMLWKFLSAPKREQATFVLQNNTYRGVKPRYCDAPNCTRLHVARGFCKKHYRELPDVQAKDLAAYEAFNTKRREQRGRVAI